MGRKNLSPVSHSIFTLVSGLLFDHSLVLDLHAKIQAALQSTVVLTFSSLVSGTLLRVCPVTDKGSILALCFLPSGVVPVLSEDEVSLTLSASSLANLVVSCDDGTFCLLQCGVAHSPSPKPLVDK